MAIFNIASSLALEKNLEDKISWCKRHLKKVSKGSSRYVFFVDDATVLKIAYSEAGIEQNNVEFNDALIGQLGAKSYAKDDGYVWITQEYAEPVDEETFERLSGKPFQFMHDFVYGVRRTYVLGTELPHDFKELLVTGNTIFKEVYEYLLRAKIDACVDYGKMTSWGKRKTSDGDKLIIVDYGVNDEVYRKYYKIKK